MGNFIREDKTIYSTVASMYIKQCKMKWATKFAHDTTNKNFCNSITSHHAMEPVPWHSKHVNKPKILRFLSVCCLEKCAHHTHYRPCLINPANSSSVLLSISGKGTSTPLCKTFSCLGFILFSKLNEKYWGNSCNSSNFLSITTAKYSNFGLKLFSMLNVNRDGHLKAIPTASSRESPKLSKYFSLGIRVISILETNKTESL